MSTSDPDLINGLVNRMKDAATDPDGRIDAKAVVVACSKLAMLVLMQMSRSGDDNRQEAVRGASIAALGFADLAVALEKGPLPQ